MPIVQHPGHVVGAAARSVKYHGARLYDVCQHLYDRSGQSLVYDLINRHFPEIPWAWCGDCDCESPNSEDTCLVCGAEVRCPV